MPSIYQNLFEATKAAFKAAKKNGKSYLDISKSEVMTLLPGFKKETQIIISQTCPPKIVFKGSNTSSDIRNSIKYIESTNAFIPWLPKK